MLAATESSSDSTSSDEPHRMLWNTASGPPRDAENLEHRLWADRHVIAHEFAKRSFGAHHRPPARRDQFRERLLDPEQCQDMARSAPTVQ